MSTYILGQYDHQGEKTPSNWMSSLYKQGDFDIKPTLLYTPNLTNESALLINAGASVYESSFKNVGLRIFSVNSQLYKPNFQKDITYYCRCAIRKEKHHATFFASQQYQIKLVSSEAEDDHYIAKEQMQQYVKTVTVINSNPSQARQIEDEWDIIDFIFTPQASGFDTLLFYLMRTENDYKIENRISRIVFLECSRINSLKDITPEGFSNVTIHNQPYLKIGVQAAPGLRMVINNEEIYVGRTGIYELKNSDIKIGPIGFVTSAEQWSNVGDFTAIKNALKNFKEDTDSTGTGYFVTDSKGNKVLNVNNDNDYCYYRYVINARHFPSFTLDYIYEENTQ